MQVTITERHCEVPKRTVQRSESQIAALERFEARATHAELVFTDERHVKKAEAVVHVDGAPIVTARGEGDSYRAALDQVVDRLGRLLREQRERRRDHQAPPLAERLAEE